MASTKASLLLVIFISAAILRGNAAAAAVADELCGRTSRKDLCLSIVKADLRPDLKTNPKGIAAILRDKAEAEAGATLLKIAALTKSATDKRAIESLRRCSSDYFNLINTLTTSDLKVINPQTYPKIAIIIIAGIQAPRHCELLFELPPAIPSPLTQDNESVEQISGTTLEVVSLITCNRNSCF